MSDAIVPPKRFTIGPLPEDHDELLILWAWYKRRTKASMATHTLEARIEVNKNDILEGIRRCADRRGISFEDMKALILKNPRYDWNEPEAEEGEAES